MMSQQGPPVNCCWQTRSQPSPPAQTAGFTLIEALVALLILGLGLGIGLGAIVRGRVALELVALQGELDQSLDQLHEAVRSRSLAVEDLARIGTASIEPFTFRVSEGAVGIVGGASGNPALNAEVTATDLNDLFEVTLSASGRRGRLERQRILTTRFYEPGLSARLAEEP